MYLCIYVSMYLYSYPCTHGISGLAAGGAGEQFEVHLKMTIQWTQRYTLRVWLREFRDALGGDDRANLEAVIEQVRRCTWEAMSMQTWRPESSDHGGRDQVNFEMHSQAMIEWVGSCTWRPWLSQFGDALGGRDRERLNEYLEAVNGRRAGCWDPIRQLVNSQPCECDKLTLLLSSHGELADGGRLYR